MTALLAPHSLDVGASAILAGALLSRRRPVERRLSLGRRKEPNGRAVEAAEARFAPPVGVRDQSEPDQRLVKARRIRQRTRDLRKIAVEIALDDDNETRGGSIRRGRPTAGSRLQCPAR